MKILRGLGVVFALLLAPAVSLGAIRHGAGVASPVISGMVAPTVSKTQGAPALWQVAVTDPNSSPMVSATITLSGSTTGTLSHIGPFAPSGGPTVYSFSAMTPANLTRALDNLLWQPGVTSVGTVTTFTLTVTNAVGGSAVATNTITNVAPVAMPTPLTPVATPAALPANYRGLNLSGSENTPRSSQIYQTFPGEYANSSTSGFQTIRFPFLFTYTNIINQGGQFPPNGPSAQLYANFNSYDLGNIQAAVELARQYGQYIILDDHSFGYIQNPFPTGTSDDAPAGVVWGSDIRAPNDGWADLWQRNATYFKNYPNVILSLGNEVDIGGWSGAQQVAASILALAAIRTVNTSVLVIMPSVTNVGNFAYSNWAGFSDPSGGPWAFDVHQYFDGAGGTLNTCTSTPVTSYFSTYTAWLNANNYKSFVSEFAWGTDASCMSSLGASIVSYFNANANVYPGWQWWGGGDFAPSYQFYMQGSGSGIGWPAQYSLLSPYLP